MSPEVPNTTDGAMRPLRHPTLWRGIGWLMLAVITVAMAMPAPEVDLAIDHADKWVHVFAFAVLGGWSAQLYPPSPALVRRGLGLLAFAAGTELMQAIIPWRSADWGDLTADAFGVGLGLLLAFGPAGRGLLRVERLLRPTT
ncbi:MAG: VanZ family protein [Pseudomarimonas sp.]